MCRECFVHEFHLWKSFGDDLNRVLWVLLINPPVWSSDEFVHFFCWYPSWYQAFCGDRHQVRFWLEWFQFTVLFWVGRQMLTCNSFQGFRFKATWSSTGRFFNFLIHFRSSSVNLSSHQWEWTNLVPNYPTYRRASYRFLPFIPDRESFIFSWVILYEEFALWSCCLKIFTNFEVNFWFHQWGLWF